MSKILQFPLAARLAQVAADRAQANDARLAGAQLALDTHAPVPSAPKAKPPTPRVEYVKTQGAAYDAAMDLKDIAKLVRKDIKRALKEGRIPEGTKCSVRISRFSMGQSLTVSVTKCSVLLANPAWYEAHAVSDFEAQDRIRHILHAGRELIQELENIAGRYNRSERESQTDYYNCNFFLSADIDGQLLTDQAMEILDNGY